MEEKTLILKVDLSCYRCNKKIRKTLCKLQDRENIRTVVYDEKNNVVLVTGTFDPKRLSRKLCCLACKVIKDIQLQQPPPPPKPKPDPPPPPPAPPEAKPDPPPPPPEKPKPDPPPPPPEEPKPEPPPKPPAKVEPEPPPPEPVVVVVEKPPEMVVEKPPEPVVEKPPPPEPAYPYPWPPGPGVAVWPFVPICWCPPGYYGGCKCGGREPEPVPAGPCHGRGGCRCGRECDSWRASPPPVYGGPYYDGSCRTCQFICEEDTSQCRIM